MLAVAIFTTHALSMYVAIDIVWTQNLLRRFEKSMYVNIWEYAIRTTLVVLTCRFNLCCSQSTTFCNIIVLFSWFGSCRALYRPVYLIGGGVLHLLQWHRLSCHNGLVRATSSVAWQPKSPGAHQKHRNHRICHGGSCRGHRNQHGENH